MSNRQIITELYDSFLTGDPEPARHAFTDQSVWVEPDGTSRSGTFRGPDAITAHAENCLRMTDGTFSRDLREILGGDSSENFVVVIDRVRGLRNGASLNMLVNTVYEMSDGVIKEIRVLPHDLAAWNAFWS